ncbi:MAG: DUF1573 domain-containing protein [Bacteroidales bacterium]|nr:DUF1573 domain-containing protein [Bacteroidales bacterium]
MKKILILGIIIGLFLGVQAQSKTTSKSTGKAVPTATKSTAKYTGTGPEIEFEKSYVDFGIVKVGEVKVVTVTFKNIGKKPLILDEVISSCDCTTVQWSKEPIMPGQKGTIKARYEAENVGLISKRLTVLSNANTDRVILQLKGEVK